MEKKNGKKMENNGENSGPLTSLPVSRLTATDCNAAARANFSVITRLSRCEHLDSLVIIEQYCDIYSFLYNKETMISNPGQAQQTKDMYLKRKGRSQVLLLESQSMNYSNNLN